MEGEKDGGEENRKTETWRINMTYEHYLHNEGMERVNEACADHWLHDILRYSTQIISFFFLFRKMQPR